MEEGDRQGGWARVYPWIRLVINVNWREGAAAILGLGEDPHGIDKKGIRQERRTRERGKEKRRAQNEMPQKTKKECRMRAMENGKETQGGVTTGRNKPVNRGMGKEKTR